MNILHVIDSLAVGGAERVVVELANQASRDGHRVAVCITRSETSLTAALRPEIDLWVLGRQRRFDFPAMKRFAGLVRQHRIDLIQAHSRSTVAFLSVLKTLKMIRLPIVFLDHYGIEIDTSVPWWFRWWGKHYLSHYVGVYGKLADWARASGITPEKITTIGNALDLEPLMQIKPKNLKGELGLGEDILLGITVAGLRREKGLDVLIEAMARTILQRAIKIVVVGGVRDQAYVNYCQGLIESRGLRDVFLFLGERQDVISLLKGADFAVMPSRSESGPLTLIEYLACGLPVVSTKVGDISNQASELGIQEFVPPDDIDALAQGLTRLFGLASPEFLARGRQGLEICFKYFDIRQKMPLWYQVYEKVVPEKSFS